MSAGGRTRGRVGLVLVLLAIVAGGAGGGVVACGGAAGAIDAGGDGPVADAAVDDAAADDAIVDDAIVADAAVDAALPLAMFEPGEELPVGAWSTPIDGEMAFAQPVVGLAGSARTAFFAGQAQFEIDWTVATATSASDRDGLGPRFHATSCRACHVRNGRGAPPLEPGGELATALVRVSLPGVDADGGPLAHPIYGRQLQPRAIAGVPLEAVVRLLWEPAAGTYGDGSGFELLRPRLTVEARLGDPGPGLLTSVRVAPATIGLGYLAAIPAAAIVAREDAGDADGDGISGRANWIADGGGAGGAARLGRFGWKANEPTLAVQIAGALRGDLGITSPLAPDEDCPAAAGPACGAAPTGGAPEIDGPRLEATVVFTAATSVPRRLGAEAAVVLQGKRVFGELGCAGCHVPRWTTGDAAEVPWPWARAVVIWPYTDLLVHDLGDGLADGRPDHGASGSEWRTPPLWGLSRLQRVSGHLRLLHDGRARGVAEAILWHGGEAAAARERFRLASPEVRAALVRFVESL